MATLEPITRNEKFYKAIADSDSTGLPEPKTREELFLNAIATGNKEGLPEPVTRQEIFLREIADAGGDVTIEPLTATENGTYSEERKAYKPVVVDVATPENAYLLKSATDGDIVTFTDGANLPMPSLKLGINPQQEGSGDPSPTNVRPISGHTEANIIDRGIQQWDEQWELGQYDASGNPYPNNDCIRTKNFIPIKDNIQYREPFGNGTMQIFYYDANKTFISSVWASTNVFTTPSNACFMKFRLSSTYGTTYNNDISINYPSTDTSYHAYNGQTYTIDLDGTRYGGTFDVVSGVLTVDRKYILIDGDTKKVSSWGTANPNGFTTYISDANIKRTNKIISDRFKYSGSSIGSMPSFSTGGGSGNDGVISFVLDNTITTINEANDWFTSNNTSVVAELATPITVQLTPTLVKSLLNTNNVWNSCNGGITDLTYFSKA